MDLVADPGRRLLAGVAGLGVVGRADASPDTLRRRVKNSAGEPAPPPRYLGVDDWALRKGQRYGTILIDLERGRVIDIFKGRDGSALAAWLKEHPGVEVITRDRWAAFAQAATAGAPKARQVADRWHLLKNLREAVEQLLAGHSGQLREVLMDTLAVAAEAATPARAPPGAASAQPPADLPSHPGGQRRPRSKRAW